MLKTLAGEGITFDDILIDRSMPEDCASTRKPRTGMLTKYISNPEYDLEGSFVIGDRPTDVEMSQVPLPSRLRATRISVSFVVLRISALRSPAKRNSATRSQSVVARAQ